jgi:hypothetical protein
LNGFSREKQGEFSALCWLTYEFQQFNWENMRSYLKKKKKRLEVQSMGLGTTQNSSSDQVSFGTHPRPMNWKIIPLAKPPRLL